MAVAQTKRKKSKTRQLLLWRRRILGNRLGDILLHADLITTSELYAALEEQSATKKPLGTVLIQQGAITPNTLIRTLHKQFYKRLGLVILLFSATLLCH